jgi:transposase
LKKERRNWSAGEKIKLLRRHLIENVPISKICEDANLAPSLFHRWQEQLFQNAALALTGKRPERNQDQQRIEKLESKIRQKDEVLAELMAEHISLKKRNLGNSERLLGRAGHPGRRRGFHPQMATENRLGHRTFVAISGWPTGRRPQSWIFKRSIQWKATAA